jgi:hypothetical protein
MTPAQRADAARPLLPNGGDRRSRTRGQTDRTSRQGNTADYLARRIARDRPDVLQGMKAGAYPSVRQAALEAGIAKPAITVRLDDARSAARTLRKHGTPAFLAALVRELT